LATDRSESKVEKFKNFTIFWQLAREPLIVLSRYRDFRKTFPQNLVTYFGCHIAIRIISRSCCWIKVVYFGLKRSPAAGQVANFFVLLVCAILSHSFCFCASLSLSPNFSLSSLDISISSAASKQANKQASKLVGGIN
jgi:hypothetical protein